MRDEDTVYNLTTEWYRAVADCHARGGVIGTVWVNSRHWYYSTPWMATHAGPLLRPADLGEIDVLFELTDVSGGDIPVAPGTEGRAA